MHICIYKHLRDRGASLIIIVFGAGKRHGARGVAPPMIRQERYLRVCGMFVIVSVWYVCECECKCGMFVNVSVWCVSKYGSLLG
jgi:hypothetical protein